MELYRIGSFNLFKFSANSSKKLDVVARIIIENNVDILSVQEIFSKAALDNLLKELGSRWEGRWASPDSKSVSAAEGYAFIWNNERISLSQRRNGSFFEPVIHNQYPHRDGVELIRNPFYGRFVAKSNTMIEFRIINTHIMFSLNREENDSEDHDSSLSKIGAVGMRKKEFEILASKILPKIDDKVYDYQWDEVDDICRKPYTFLMGDYNLNLKESGASDAFIEQPLIVIRDANSEKRIITVQDQLTTLRAKTEENQPISGYRNNYDHFTYDENRPITTRCWAVDIPNNGTYYVGDSRYDDYKKEISDHLMVIMEIEFT